MFEWEEDYESKNDTNKCDTFSEDIFALKTQFAGVEFPAELIEDTYIAEDCDLPRAARTILSLVNSSKLPVADSTKLGKWANGPPKTLKKEEVKSTRVEKKVDDSKVLKTEKELTIKKESNNVIVRRNQSSLQEDRQNVKLLIERAAVSYQKGGLEGRAVAGFYRNKAFDLREVIKRKEEDLSQHVFTIVNKASIETLFFDRDKIDHVHVPVLDLHGQTCRQAIYICELAIDAAIKYKV